MFKQHNIMVCRFKRTEDTEWEYGFLIDEQYVVDFGGQSPEQLRDYQSMPHRGCINVVVEGNSEDGGA